MISPVSPPVGALQGVLPVFQTPFHDDETIDLETLQRELDWLFERGADGVVMAMVSETLRLSLDERRHLATEVVRRTAGRGPVIISVGAESGHTAVGLTRHAHEVGATAVMAIPPISTALGDEELLRYYERIVRASPLAVIVQDASGYVGRPMSIDVQARLLREFGGQVYFKPEAPPLGPRVSSLLQATDGQARIFEGSGGIALVESFERGVIGTMPGAEMIDGIVGLWQALEAGDARRVDRLAPPIALLVSLQSSLDAYLAVEKYLLRKQGIFRNEIVRGPVGYRLDDITRRQVDRWFDRLMAALRD